MLRFDTRIPDAEMSQAELEHVAGGGVKARRPVVSLDRTRLADHHGAAVDRLGILLLVVGSAFSRRVVRVEGLALSGDRLLGLAAVLLAAVLLARGRLRFSPTHWALTLFVAVQILTTLASAHLWPRGMRLVIIYVMGLACFMLTAHFAASS